MFSKGKLGGKEQHKTQQHWEVWGEKFQELWGFGRTGGRTHGILLPSVPARDESQWDFPSFSSVIPHFPLQNHSNSDVVSIDCEVKLAPNEELNLHLRGNLWMKSLKAVSAHQKMWISPENVDFREKSPKGTLASQYHGGFPFFGVDFVPKAIYPSGSCIYSASLWII